MNNEYGFIYGEDIVRNLLQQYDLEEVLRLYRSGLIDFDLRNRFNFCMGELLRREARTDIKVADFIKENYQQRKLFCTHNHPTTFLFEEVCRQIVKHVDLSFDLLQIEVDNDNQAKLSQTNTPISPSDVEIHGYQFAPHDNWFSQGKELIVTIHQSVLSSRSIEERCCKIGRVIFMLAFKTAIFKNSCSKNSYGRNR